MIFRAVFLLACLLAAAVSAGANLGLRHLIQRCTGAPPFVMMRTGEEDLCPNQVGIMIHIEEITVEPAGEDL